MTRTMKYRGKAITNPRGYRTDAQEMWLSAYRQNVYQAR